MNKGRERRRRSINNSNKQGECTIFKGGDKGFKGFKIRMKSFGGRKSRFVISGKRSRKRILKSTSKFKERIGRRTSRDERRRRSRFMPGLTES